MNTSTHANATIKLTEASLSRLPKQVQIPQYDRHQITNGIVHIGVGGFHRAHQALYLDNYFHQTNCTRHPSCSALLSVSNEPPPDFQRAVYASEASFPIGLTSLTNFHHLSSYFLSSQSSSGSSSFCVETKPCIHPFY